MALGAPPRGPDGILREIQINLLECKVCFEKFSAQQKERRPQSLPCGHVLCLECIRALAHPLLRKLECPFCRQLSSVDGTSHCQVLSDLQELLMSWTPASSAPLHQAKGGLSSDAGLTRTSLRLCSAFAGWGTLINPTGIAVFRSSGTIAVVHDGEKRVVLLGPQGKILQMFGPRGRGDGEICYPVDVAVTPCGHVVVTDAGENAVKVFSSRGNHVLTVRRSFQMPWGLDSDSTGHILVSDAQAGTLSQLKVDYNHGLLQGHLKVLSDLQCPKEVACSWVTGNTAVLEHFPNDKSSSRFHQQTRLRVYSRDFQVLYQTDSFSLSLQSSVELHMSGVTFDGDGGVAVIDSKRRMIWSLGRPENRLVLVPLVCADLVRPAGLVVLPDRLLVLDGGDHAVKMFAVKSEAEP